MARILKLVDPVGEFKPVVASFLHDCEVRNLSPRTLHYYQEYLVPWLAFAENEGITPRSTTPQHVKDFLLYLPAKLSPATRNSHLRAVKALFGWMTREGWIEENPAGAVKQQKERRSMFPTFSQEALAKLLAQPNRKTFCGLRDYTLMVLLADTGVRISEALGLRICDVDIREGLVTVLGKGNKMRQVPIGQTTKRVLWKWLEFRGEIPGQDRIFPNRYGEVWLSRQAEKSIAEYGNKADIKGVRVSPHTFRYTFATMWLRSGGDLFTLQRILGHTSLEMVRRYAQQVVSDLQEKHRIYSPMDRLIRK